MGGLTFLKVGGFLGVLRVVWELGVFRGGNGAKIVRGNMGLNFLGRLGV